jgi:hypothetical protein
MEKSSFAAALATAQGKMSGAPKDAKNPHFKSSYASLASVVEAIRVPLAESGIAWTQQVDVEGRAVAVATILLWGDESHSWGTIRAEAKDTSPQAIGSTVTYLRRYSLMACLGVPAEDDDAESGQRRDDRPAPAPTVQTVAAVPHPMDSHAGEVDLWLATLGKAAIGSRDPAGLRALRQVLEVGSAQRAAFDAWLAGR